MGVGGESSEQITFKLKPKENRNQLKVNWEGEGEKFQAEETSSAVSWERKVGRVDQKLTKGQNEDGAKLKQ